MNFPAANLVFRCDTQDQGETSVSHAIMSFLQASGYLGVFITMALESACVPLPSELIMPFAGYLAGLGHLQFWGVVACGTFGNVLGASIAYSVGRYGSMLAIMRYARLTRLSEGHLQLAQRWFAGRGKAAILVARMLPIVRTFISLPAGVSRMPARPFVAYTLIGSFPWVYMLTYAGSFLGKRWFAITHEIHAFTFGTIALVALWAILSLSRRFVRGLPPNS